MAKRLNDKQKAKKLAKYNQLKQSGKTAQQAAKAVGVSYATLLKWEKGGSGGSGKRKAATGKKRGRKADAAERPARIVVTTPTGFRIEGDDPKDIAYILIELS